MSKAGETFPVKATIQQAQLRAFCDGGSRAAGPVGEPQEQVLQETQIICARNDAAQPDAKALGAGVRNAPPT